MCKTVTTEISHPPPPTIKVKKTDCMSTSCPQSDNYRPPPPPPDDSAMDTS